MAAKRKSRSDEGQAIDETNARTASNMTVLRRSRRLRGLPPLVHAQDGNTSTEMEKVGQYFVLAGYAPTLRCIFAKHGDIASNSDFPQYRSFLLMVVVIVVQKLLRSDFCYALSNLNHMKNLVQYVTSKNLNVSWLLEHIVEIEKIRSLTIMVAIKEFDARKKIMMTAKKRFKEVQRHLDDFAYVGEEDEYDQ